MAHGIKIVKSRVFFLCYLKILIVTFFYSVVYDPNCEVLIFSINLSNEFGYTNNAKSCGKSIPDLWVIMGTTVYGIR